MTRPRTPKMFLLAEAREEAPSPWQLRSVTRELP